ncbi:cleavage stimulation factor subunit 2 CstF64 isoform X2 [Oratosquilla oratoria]|uniref:cleavage stimulation factor subunit 2 CstF64 isoform X2 n=1 Tax=Oratosquilla oratoria TaxID=337810 RepID=UPI003F777D46
MSETSAVVEKSLRSVFVGNIPYEATEEKLRDIFGQVGPVLSFKLMYDRETGKPKGYGFCEYKDQETALSAMRNLNGFEIGGRPLRVDNACTEKSRMEMQSLMMGPIVESPYGPDVDPSKAPEAISNAVASLPPEQMFELMRQMKLCVRNNPAEARTMLMNNPQLAYALLQAQVVMRIIDPKTAVQILHPSRDSHDAIMPQAPAPQPPPSVPTPTAPPPTLNGGPTSGPPPPSNLPTRYPQAPGGGPTSYPPQGLPPQGLPPQGIPPQGIPPQGPPPPVPPPARGPPFPGGDFDMRQLANSSDPRGPPPSGDQDLRMPPHSMSGPLPPLDPRARDNYGNMHPGHQDYDASRPSKEGDNNNRYGRDPRADYDNRDHRDPRYREPPPPARDPRDNYPREARDTRERDPRSYRDPRDPRGSDPRDQRGGDRDYRNDPRESRDPRDARDPRSRVYNQDKDFRGSGSPGQMGAPTQPPPTRGPVPPPAATAADAAAAVSASSLPSLAGQDQEKASLIMQVLQLSDEQIQMLSPEQRASIMQLKEQIHRSQQ